VLAKGWFLDRGFTSHIFTRAGSDAVQGAPRFKAATARGDSLWVNSRAACTLLTFPIPDILGFDISRIITIYVSRISRIVSGGVLRISRIITGSVRDDRPRNIFHDRPRDVLRDRPRNVLHDRPGNVLHDRPGNILHDRPRNIIDSAWSMINTTQHAIWAPYVFVVLGIICAPRIIVARLGDVDIARQRYSRSAQRQPQGNRGAKRNTSDAHDRTPILAEIHFCRTPMPVGAIAGPTARAVR
jgi:hypothetical protein